MLRDRLALCIGLALSPLGCSASIGEPAVPLTPPTELCTRDRTTQCRHPAQIERWLRDPQLEIVHATGTPAGKQGAKVLTVSVPHEDGRVVLRAKWRAHSTAHQLNRPRKEIAAYATQQLFLEPSDYVVPPTTGHCFELQHYRARVNRTERASFPGISCVFGTLSYWLESAEDLDSAEDHDLIASEALYDEQLFTRNATYRRTLADVNLLSYLISHGDSHPAQFVFVGDQTAPRVYLVDNTIAFSKFRNPSLPPDQDWSNVHVPALRSASIRRLRSLRFEDIAELAVVEQYKRDDDCPKGVGRWSTCAMQASARRLVPTRRTPPRGKTSDGLRWVGDEFQVGLDEQEIALVHQRVQSLLQRVEDHLIATF
jgi:hypothetical protein